MQLSTRRSIIVTVAGVAAVAWACDAGRPASPAGQPLATASAARATLRPPSPHVLRVGEVHNRALLRFFGDLDSYIGKRGHRSTASRCAGLRRLAREVIREAGQNAGIAEAPALDQARADDAVSRAMAGCGPRRQASLFTPTRQESGGEIVSASVVPHLEALQAGYNALPDPYSPAITAVNDAVLSGMSSEPQANYNVAAMTAQFALDDAAMWVGFGEALGDSAFCDPAYPDTCLDPPDEMTLFAPKYPVWVARALYGTLVDLGGCLYSEIQDARAGNVSEKDMYISCAVVGVAASGAYGMKVLGVLIDKT